MPDFNVRSDSVNVELIMEQIRERIRENFQRLAASGAGTFALIDYVNFKGEGTKAEERYKGEGWGMLQVLENMSEGEKPVSAFAKSAAEAI